MDKDGGRPEPAQHPCGPRPLGRHPAPGTLLGERGLGLPPATSYLFLHPGWWPQDHPSMRALEFPAQPASLQLQPPPHGPGPQPAPQALVVPDTAPARAPKASLPQYPCSGGSSHRWRCQWRPLRGGSSDGPGGLDRRFWNGQGTGGRKQTDSERTAGWGSLMASTCSVDRGLLCSERGKLHPPARLPGWAGAH